MLCGAARGTIIVTTAVAPTATGTIRTTGTTISDFVAPVFKLCGDFPHKARIAFFTEKVSVRTLSPDPAPVSAD